MRSAVLPPSSAIFTALVLSLVGCGGAGHSESTEPPMGVQAATVTPSAESEDPAPPPPNAGPRQPISTEAPPDAARPPTGAETSATGVASRVLWRGHSDARPRAQDIVIVHYSAWTTDGQRFDSSVERGRPSVFPLNAMIPGWSEGVRQMTVGEQRRLWIPEAQAYGGAPGRPEGTLVYDVELIAIEAVPPVVPADVAAPPANAEVTSTGLASVVLQAGTGTERPLPANRVTVHYTGWHTDGRMFDSSVARGSTATFPLDHVIPGWTEGLQLMVEGEKRRFWIPEDLAYAGRAGTPQGMLVFDVTLIHIE